MKKLAILALIYLFCLELAYADSKKDIEFIKGKFEGKFKNPFFWAPYVYVGI